MFLAEPEPTAFDLRWRMFGIPVRVHPLFWLVTAILGWEKRVDFFLLWMGCAFFSILIHELGHVVMGQLFGSSGRIVLYGMGGLAVGSNHLSSRWQRIAVSFAGPLADFLLLGVIYLILVPWNPARAQGFLGWMASLFGIHIEVPPEIFVPPLLSEALWYLIIMNLFWGLINLAPIYPLDGGQISRDVCIGMSPRKGLRTSLAISILVAGLLAINAVVAESRGVPLIPYLPAGGLYMALLFGLLALGNFQEFQQLGPPSRSSSRGRAPWERDPDYWKR